MRRLLMSFLSILFVPLVLWPSFVAAREINVGTWKTAQTIQPFFYEHFYASEARISVIPFTNPVDQKSALLAGDLDMCGTTLVHAIQSAVKGEPVVLVASLCNRCSALVVGRDSGVQDVRDLKGKKIGYVPGTMHEVLLRELLNRNGLLPEKDVTLLRVDFFDMGTALAAGNIDAFLSGEPFPTLAVDKGYGRILAYPYFDDCIGTINAAMLVRKKSIEEEPELVYQLVLAHAQSTRYLREHPDAWLKKASEFGLTGNLLEKAAPNMELVWEMDETFIARTRALGERMRTLKVIDREPDYGRLFDLSFVRRVQDELSRHKPGDQ